MSNGHLCHQHRLTENATEVPRAPGTTSTQHHPVRSKIGGLKNQQTMGKMVTSRTKTAEFMEFIADVWLLSWLITRLAMMNGRYDWTLLDTTVQKAYFAMMSIYCTSFHILRHTQLDSMLSLKSWVLKTRRFLMEIAFMQSRKAKAAQKLTKT